jgi:hypothetical protein
VLRAFKEEGVRLRVTVGSDALNQTSDQGEAVGSDGSAGVLIANNSPSEQARVSRFGNEANSLNRVVVPEQANWPRGRIGSSSSGGFLGKLRICSGRLADDQPSGRV